MVLHHGKRTPTDLEKETVQIKKKFLATNFPSRFMYGVCNDFLNKDNNQQRIGFIIPPGFFDVKPPVSLIEIPNCDKNEAASKQLIKKVNKFTNDKYDIGIKWFTRKMKNFFQTERPCIHPAYKIYKGVCICGETYIEETIGNVETKWKEHNTLSDKSNPSKHINSQLDHIFTWPIIYNAPTNKFKRKIIEAYFKLHIFLLRINITFLNILKIFDRNFNNIFNVLVSPNDEINFRKASGYRILII